MAFGVSRKRVLVVGGEGVALFGPTPRGIEREAALAWEVPNFDQQLVEALTEQNKGDPVQILFDGADQTYRKEENVPKLSVFDRSRYIRRKLEQAFPSYPVRASVLVKPPGEPPFYLFVALPETDRLDNIAADMLEAGVPVAGFGLLPAESVGLVTALAAKIFTKEDTPSKWAVLVSQHETGGLRQVVVKNGNLALTRITPTSEAGVHGPGWADEVMREFKATLTYIARFGYTAEEGLDVMVICSSIEKQFFSDKSLPVTNFQCLTTAEALSAIGSKGVSLGETNFGDALHAAWVAKKRSLAAPIVVPSIQRIMVPRKAAQLTSGILALTLVGAGFFAFSQYTDYISVRNDMTERQRQKDLLDQEYTQDSKVFDAYPVKPQLIKNVLAVKELVDNSTINITPTLNVLRRALDNDIKLNSLSFTHDAASVFAAGSGRGAVPPKPAAPGKERGQVTIRFKFSLIGSLDLEHKVQRAEGLVKELQQKFPGYNVKILSQFGNVTNTGKFEGEAGKTADAGGKQEDTAEFEMTGAPL
jgi:hypothetical protein